MKERIDEKEAKEEAFKIKMGYKKGIIRIWQKMAEYQ